MDRSLPAELVPKIVAAIPEGETLVSLSLVDRGEQRVRYFDWPSGWATGIVEVEVQTYGSVDGVPGIKTWTAFRKSDSYALRLDGFRSDAPPPVLGVRQQE